MADLSDNSPSKDGEIVVDAPKERVVDGEDETPRSTNTQRHQKSTPSSSRPRTDDKSSVAKAILVDPLAPRVKLVLIQNGRVLKKPSFLRLNAKIMMSTRDSIRAQKSAKNLSWLKAWRST